MTKKIQNPPEAKPKKEISELESLLHNRQSCRGFLPDSIPPKKLDQLFLMAQRSPSWCNVQPWRMVVTGPKSTEKVRQELLEQAKSTVPNPDLAFPYVYPAPYDDLRKKCGGALYGAMGIAREEKSKRYDAWLRNFQIFDAPHLVIVSRNQDLGEYATLDVGVWLGTLLLAAQSLGIAACPMASVVSYPDSLRKILKIPEEEVILFGVALGLADPMVAANKARTDREALGVNLRYVDCVA